MLCTYVFTTATDFEVKLLHPSGTPSGEKHVVNYIAKLCKNKYGKTSTNNNH